MKNDSNENVFQRKDVDKVCKYLQSKEEIGAIGDWGLNFLHVFKNPDFTILRVSKKMWQRVILPELKRIIHVRVHSYNHHTNEGNVYTGVNKANAEVEKLRDGDTEYSTEGLDD